MVAIKYQKEAKIKASLLNSWALVNIFQPPVTHLRGKVVTFYSDFVCCPNQHMFLHCFNTLLIIYFNIQQYY